MTLKNTTVLFVCLGNICRSPTAQGVFEYKLRQVGLSEAVETDSAGTSDWHIGSPPDKRSVQAGKNRGFDFSHLRGRQVQSQDFEMFDYILAMDEQNLSDLESIKPKAFSGHLGLFLDFAKDTELLEVPDPYYGGDSGFGLVLDLCESASDGLIEDIQKRRSSI